MKRVLSVLFAVLAIALGVWWSRAGRPATTIGPEQTDGAVPVRVDAALPGRGEVGESAPSPEPVSDAGALGARSELKAPVLAARALDVEGGPVSGAQVSWTTLPDQPGMVGPERWLFDRTTLGSGTLWTRTDATGSFLFSERPPGSDERASAIWVTCPGYRAGAVVLEPDAAVEAGAVVQLEAGTDMRVEIVDGAGKSVPGAEIRQRALVPDPARSGVPLEIEDRARFVLFRAHRAGADGSASLPSLGGRQRVQARSTDRMSAAWSGGAREQLVLSLLDSFRAEGSVVLSGAGEVEGDLQVVVVAQQGSVERTLDRVPVEFDSLRWGPVELPVTRADRLAFHVEGGNVVPVAVFAPVQSAGALLHLALSAPLGNFLYFQMRNEAGETLLAGQADVTWSADGEQRTASAQPDEEGYIQVRGLPDGIVQPTFTSPGYAMTAIPAMTLPQEEVFVDLVTLFRGASLSGRCLADGEPVSDFELMFWPASFADSVERRQVLGSEDGLFQIETAPLGRVSIAAASGTRPRSEIYQVEVTADGTAHVEIELPRAESARGRVVDDSGEVLASAEVQLYSGNGALLLSPWGPPVPVHPDGTFEVTGLSPGRSFFEVSAPEYSTRKVGAEVVPGQVLELGDLRLVPRQTLEVHITVPPGADATRYSIQGPASAPALAAKRFDSGGLAVFEGVDAGAYDLLLRLPDGGLQQIKVDLRPGAPWSVEVEAAGTTRLTVRVEGEGVLDLHPDSLILLEFVDRSGSACARAGRLRGEVEVSIEGLSSGRYTVSLRDDLEIVSTMTIDLAEGEDRRETIRLGGRDVLVRVVDASGTPLSGVTVQLYDAADLHRWDTSDAAGMVAFRGVPEQPAWFGLSHATRGSAWGLSLEDGFQADGVLELELIADARFELRLVDGDTPAVNVGCQLRDPLRHLGATVSTSTDAEGRTRWTRLAEGAYSLVTFHEDWWPMEAEVRVTPEAAPVTLQIRRRGNLTLAVRAPDGTPITGIRPQLTSVEFATEVVQWLAEESIEVVPAGGATGSDGRVRFERLPRGAYRWSLPASDGTLALGTLEVAGGTTTVVTLTRP